MQVKSYKYIVPDDTGRVQDLERGGYMTPQYINLVDEYISNISIKGKCAFLYAGGAVLPASEARNTEDKGVYREPGKTSGLCIKELAAYSMHKWIGRLKDRDMIEYANINGNTCASGLHAVYEAQQLLSNGFDEVIIVAEEKTSYNTLRVFDEMNIDIKVGEGLAIVHLHKCGGVSITDAKWSYEYNRNPFGTTNSGYSKVDTVSDIINPHGTGTQNNEDAEKSLVNGRTQIRYKEKYGHTQGISGLLELCLILDEPITGAVLCVAAGLGGFYGSCVVHM